MCLDLDTKPENFLLYDEATIEFLLISRHIPMQPYIQAMRPWASSLNFAPCLHLLICKMGIMS